MMRKVYLLAIATVLLIQLVSVAGSVNERAIEARIAKLEAKVDLLEAWATRHGGKLK